MRGVKIRRRSGVNISRRLTLEEMRKRLRQLVHAYEQAADVHGKLDPLVRTWLHELCHDELDAILAVPELTPVDDSGKAEVMKGVLSKDRETRIAAREREAQRYMREEELARSGQREPRYVVAARDVLDWIDRCIKAIRDESGGRRSKHRPTQSAKHALIEELAHAFERYSMWSAGSDAFYGKPKSYQQTLLECIRLVLSNAEIACPADKALAELIPEPLRQPPAPTP